MVRQLLANVDYRYYETYRFEIVIAIANPIDAAVATAINTFEPILRRWIIEITANATIAIVSIAIALPVAVPMSKASTLMAVIISSLCELVFGAEFMEAFLSFSTRPSRCTGGGHFHVFSFSRKTNATHSALAALESILTS